MKIKLFPLLLSAVFILLGCGSEREVTQTPMLMVSDISVEGEWEEGGVLRASASCQECQNNLIEYHWSQFGEPLADGSALLLSSAIDYQQPITLTASVKVGNHTAKAVVDVAANRVVELFGRPYYQPFFSGGRAFSARKSDGSVVAWGDPRAGGDTSQIAAQLSQVTKLFGDFNSLGVVKDNSILVWGFDSEDAWIELENHSLPSQIISSSYNYLFYFDEYKPVKTKTYDFGLGYGWDNSAVSHQLKEGILEVMAHREGFVARSRKGALIAWGAYEHIPHTELASGFLQLPVSTDIALSALKNNGEIVTWGKYGYRNAPSSVFGDFVSIHSDPSGEGYGFAAITDTGKVVYWEAFGTSIDLVVEQDAVDVAVAKNKRAAVVLMSDGQVVSWNVSTQGVEDELYNITSIQRLGRRNTFLAQRSDNRLIIWGDTDLGYQSGLVPGVDARVMAQCESQAAMALVLESGKAVVIGRMGSGANTAQIDEHLSEGVIDVACVRNGFAITKKNGEVVSWGYDTYGTEKIWTQVHQNIQSLVSNGYAFAALTTDGQVLAWGGESDTGNAGADLSSVAHELRPTAHIQPL
ncbi:hypothetical protein [Vibrio sp. WXL103]|uniref:hypothetical protein n=1 Tax=Vibrio sp. WXL103 TaxID=3450710 RepID=UPI003EC720AD